jgi:hypothetical protein
MASTSLLMDLKGHMNQQLDVAPPRGVVVAPVKLLSHVVVEVILGEVQTSPEFEASSGMDSPI